MASSRKITLKVQVHPSHCGLDWQAEASYHTQRKGKSDCWSCWLFTVHALKVHKYPFPIPEHSYIFTATSCLPGLVYIRSESLDVFSAFRGSLGGSSSQIHWVDTCTVSIAICILQSLAASCHMKLCLGPKSEWKGLCCILVAICLLAQLTNSLSLYKLSYMNIPVWRLRF